jgi:anti-anti-sigma regulatory factor
VAPQGPITRLLEVTGLNELFELYAGLDAAVESCALAPA